MNPFKHKQLGGSEIPFNFRFFEKLCSMKEPLACKCGGGGKRRGSVHGCQLVQFSTKMVDPEPCKESRRRPQLFMAGIVPYYPPITRVLSVAHLALQLRAWQKATARGAVDRASRMQKKSEPRGKVDETKVTQKRGRKTHTHKQTKHVVVFFSSHSGFPVETGFWPATMQTPQKRS